LYVATVNPTITPIASDSRGASWSIKIPNEDREAVLIFSRAGAYRGGHFHTKPEVSLLLTGKVHYWKQTNESGEIEFDELPGQRLVNKAGEAHLAHFLEDSWLLDWKLESGPCQTYNYKPYREKVEESLG
jgi:hypothetical protein